MSHCHGTLVIVDQNYPADGLKLPEFWSTNVVQGLCVVRRSGVIVCAFNHAKDGAHGPLWTKDNSILISVVCLDRVCELVAANVRADPVLVSEGVDIIFGFGYVIMMRQEIWIQHGLFQFKMFMDYLGQISSTKFSMPSHCFMTLLSIGRRDVVLEMPAPLWKTYPRQHALELLHRMGM